MESPTPMSRILLVLLVGALGCTPEGKPDAVDPPDSGDVAPADDSAQPDDSGTTDDTGWSCAEGSPHVEIGTGEEGFVALIPGDSVTMVHGPQGGWHLLGSVRMWNMGPIVDIHFVVRSVLHEAIVADNNYRVATVIEAECTALFWGMYGYLDVHELAVGELDTPPELLADGPLEIVMTVKDQAGLTAEAALLVTAALDPVDVEEEAPAKR
jgi:hypothetical protein